jgi:uncharacterized protein
MRSLASFAEYRYLALETMRKNGNAVVTPVWFVAIEDQLFFSAPSHTGKVKRLRHTPQARIAPCDERGNLLGAWNLVQVECSDASQAVVADQLLRIRYGWQRRMLDAFGWLRRWKYTHFVITVL